MSENPFQETDIPPDEPPETDGPKAPFDPRYPDSTPEAPYGYRADGKPYQRHHGPRGSSVAGGRMPASETQARTAAGLLASVNNITAAALVSGNLPVTGEAIQKANVQFEELAYQALLTDPALCRKILGVGVTGGRGMLLMAYAMLTAAVFPAARTEIMERRRINAATEDNEGERRDVYQQA